MKTISLQKSQWLEMKPGSVRNERNGYIRDLIGLTDAKEFKESKNNVTLHVLLFDSKGKFFRSEYFVKKSLLKSIKPPSWAGNIQLVELSVPGTMTGFIMKKEKIFHDDGVFGEPEKLSAITKRLRCATNELEDLSIKLNVGEL